jgi:drug/metabolite transporter (DMT)-like permease
LRGAQLLHRVAVNPMAAALLASALVGEAITINLILGLIAAFAGIWIATTEPRVRGNDRVATGGSA